MAFQWKPIQNLFNCQSVTSNACTGTQRRANNDHFPKDCQHSPSGSNSHHFLLHLQSSGLNMLTVSALLSIPFYQLLLPLTGPPGVLQHAPQVLQSLKLPDSHSLPRPYGLPSHEYFPPCPLIPSTKAEGEGEGRG